MNADITLTNECIKQIDYIGSISYVNICKGGTTTLPWGWTHYLVFIVIITLTILVFSLAWYCFIDVSKEFNKKEK